MSRILVTGGAGFIGSHTCVELLAKGYELVVMDNFSNSKPEALTKIKQISGRDFSFYEADMLCRDCLVKIFRENKIDAVIHFAGLKAVAESVQKPLEYYHNNLTGTLNVLSVMREYDCKTFLFSSSATVYGVDNPAPYTEDMPTHTATNPYGYTKVMIEQILRDTCVADPEFSAVLLRYFNPIGAHKSGLLGEEPNGIPNNLFPYIMQVAAGNLPGLKITGNDYPTPDGTGVRDYIHVVDLARGHVAALPYALTHQGAEAINLGTGKGSSVLEVIHSFEKTSGRTIPYEIAPRRAGDIAESYADTAKAKELLGWESKYTLDEMTADGWNYAKTSLIKTK